MIRSPERTIALRTCCDILGSDPSAHAATFRAWCASGGVTGDGMNPGFGVMVARFAGISGRGLGTPSALIDWKKQAMKVVRARSRRAAMLAGDVMFQPWIADQVSESVVLSGVHGNTQATQRMRRHLRIDSRTVLDADHDAMTRFDDMLTAFEAATGRIATPDER